MKLSNHTLREYMGAKRQADYSEERLLEAIRQAKSAFYEGEADGTLSRMEFLYWQSRYIHKRWWVLQGCILLILWCMLKLSDSGFYIQRCMGIAAPLFAVMLLPELWKNRSSGALEVECSAYYSLRQVYSARIFLFAMVDIVLLCFFSMTAVLSGRILLREMIVQFFLPYIVTCCICFTTLYSRKAGSEAFAVLLCMLWCFIWIEFVLNEKVYEAVSFPVWCAMTAVSALYLGYCIYRGQHDYKKIWEVKSLWN